MDMEEFFDSISAWDLVADIPQETRKMMFQYSGIETILKKVTITELMNTVSDWWTYEVPYKVGDVIEYKDKEYVISVVYADNLMLAVGVDKFGEPDVIELNAYNTNYKVLNHLEYEEFEFDESEDEE